MRWRGLGLSSSPPPFLLKAQAHVNHSDSGLFSLSRREFRVPLFTRCPVLVLVLVVLLEEGVDNYGVLKNGVLFYIQFLLIQFNHQLASVRTPNPS
ncbi:uncharacterized protein BDV14DRAFT_99686 [Aspergillus stella-maris]|uniref:uncharacterized protein n=1 Tax=Aspergillus stella-maris TaxID=1810926 RepID=UPI003CCD730C